MGSAFILPQDSGLTKTFGDQTVSGTKTFHRPKAAGSPIDGTDLATKDYVDGVSGPPSGAAGGDLTGTYPNPTIALTAISGNKVQANSILQGHLANDSVGSTQIIDGTIVNNNLQDSSISGNKIQASSILQGHVENGYVDLSSNQIISGDKTFHRPKAAGNPIDSEDLVTKEYADNLAIFVDSTMVYNDNGILIPNNINTEIIWHFEDHVTNNIHSGISQDLVVPSNGNYDIEAMVKFQPSSVGIRKLQLYKNYNAVTSGELLAEKLELNPSISYPAEVQLQAQKSLVFGDRLSVVAYQNSNQDLNICSGMGVSTSGIVAGMFSITGGSDTASSIEPTCRVSDPVNDDDGGAELDNGAIEIVRWTTQDFDNYNMFSAPDAEIIAPIAGKYEVICNLSFEANSNGIRDILFYVNDVYTEIAIQVSPSPAASGTVIHVSGLLDLNASDEVEVRAYQNSGGGLDLTQNNDRFSLHRVSP